MKTTALRLLPWALGLLLGLLLTYPPEALGPYRFPLAGLLAVLVLLAFTAVQINANLPELLTLEPVPDEANRPELAEPVAALVALGFERAGGPFRVNVSPPALLLAYVHREARAYATVYRTGTLPAKVAFDFVSIFEGESGALTTLALVEGAALPAHPGSLRQVLLDQPLEECWDGHRAALAWLEPLGLRARSVTPSSFEGDFRLSFRLQRAAFLARPLRAAALTLWRSATQLTPELGPLAHQPGAESRALRVRAREERIDA